MPKVKAFGRMCGIRHTWVGTRLQPSRPSDEFRRQCQWLETRPVPWPVMMASGPYSSLMRMLSEAMMSMASSQVMRSNSLLPRFSGWRSPFGSQSTRFMGYSRRPSVLLWISRSDMPEPQMTPCDFTLSGLPSIFTIWLFSSE